LEILRRNLYEKEKESGQERGFLKNPFSKSDGAKSKEKEIIPVMERSLTIKAITALIGGTGKRKKSKVEQNSIGSGIWGVNECI